MKRLASQRSFGGEEDRRSRDVGTRERKITLRGFLDNHTNAQTSPRCPLARFLSLSATQPCSGGQRGGGGGRGGGVIGVIASCKPAALTGRSGSHATPREHRSERGEQRCTQQESGVQQLEVLKRRRRSSSLLCKVLTGSDALIWNSGEPIS